MSLAFEQLLEKVSITGLYQPLVVSLARSSEAPLECLLLLLKSLPSGPTFLFKETHQVGTELHLRSRYSGEVQGMTAAETLLGGEGKSKLQEQFSRDIVVALKTGRVSCYGHVTVM